MVRIRPSAAILGILALVVMPLLLAGMTATVKAQPFTLRIFTFPSTRNVHFSLDGNAASSDDNGTATFDIFPGRYQLSIVPTGNVDGDAMYDFYRWKDLSTTKAYDNPRALNVSSSLSLIVLLKLSYLVKMVFTYNDPSGLTKQVDSSLVDRAHFAASDGVPIDVKNFKGAWFVLNRFQKISDSVWPGWKRLDNMYTADQVYVMGQNAVQHGSQKFAPAPGATWTVSLQLYEFTVIVRDLFFGSRVNGAVYIKSFNGTLVDTQKTSSGVAVFQTFPRGYYSVGVKGLLLTLPVPVIFSKPSSLEIRVFSLLDGTVVLGIGLVFCILWSRKRQRNTGVNRKPKLSGWEDGDDYRTSHPPKS